MTQQRVAELSARARTGRVVVFDTETTGLRSWDQICQIAAVEYVAGERARSICLYLCPTCEMNPFAEAVHGISMDFLALHGDDPCAAMARFFDFLGEDALLVAHNSRFDLRMLDQECREFGIARPPVVIDVCDTVALARFMRPGLSSYKLERLISEFGIPGRNSHDALDDTIACANLFFHLLK